MARAEERLKSRELHTRLIQTHTSLFSLKGKVHNPTGEGVRAVNTKVQAKAQKLKSNQVAADTTEPDESHETKVKDVGTARRNITRKKSGASEGAFDSSKKKQGGHGKGKWKDFTDGSLEDYAGEPLNEDDPLYDETEDRYILSSGDMTTEPTGFHEDGKAIYGPMLTLMEFKIRLAESIREYFDSADSDEVIRSIEELKCRAYHPEVVKRAVSLSLDEGPRERELVSRLLTCLHPTPLSEEDMEEGFELLLKGLEELSIDCPDAQVCSCCSVFLCVLLWLTLSLSQSMIGCFLARAVVDEVLPPKYLSTQNNDRPGDPVVEKAVSLLSREHCTARLERVWGPGDGRPVAELKTVLDHLLKEYLMSRELDEAARCVRELNASHFHHELVKRGVTHAMESTDPKNSLDAMSALFSFLVKNAIISEYQVAKGISRLKKLLSDLTLDVPTAPELLSDFEDMCHEMGSLPTSTTVAAPAEASDDEEAEDKEAAPDEAP